MNKGYISYLLTAVLLTVLTVSSVHANAWNNFWNNVGNAVNNYNTNVLATGDQVNEAIKNKDANAAFDNYLAGIQKTGDDALADSKALGVALKELVQSIPKAIKALWDKIVDAILKLRDKFCKGNSEGDSSAPPANEPPAQEPPAEEPPAQEPPAEEPPAEEPPAEEPPAEEPPAEEQPVEEQPPTEEAAAGELSDDPFPEDGDFPDDEGAAAPKASATSTPFVRAFATSNSFGDKLETFNQYNEKLAELLQLVGTMEEEHRDAVASRVSFLADEVSALKAIIEKDIKEALAKENNEDVFVPLTNAANSEDEGSMDIVRTAVRAVNGYSLDGGSQSEAVAKFMNSVRD